jgi:hypothetical protein
MHFILTNVLRRDRVVTALAKAAGGKVKSTWDGVTPPCIVGNNNGMDEVQRVCNRKKIPYLYIDHAYFTRHPQMEWFRLCVSSYHCTDWRDSDRDAKPKLKDWRVGAGNSVVIIRPAEKVGAVHPVEDWFKYVTETLPKHTSRPIVVKSKGEGALTDVLAKAWAAVCFGSVADVDAVRLGVPVFAAPTSAAYPMGCPDISQIESPIYPDRAQWVRSLSAAEWHMDEATKAWERVAPLL